MEENNIPVPEDTDSDSFDTDGNDFGNNAEEIDRTNRIMFEALVRLRSDLKQIVYAAVTKFGLPWEILGKGD